MSDTEYPKMVYPDDHGVHNINAGSVGVANFAGVIVQNEDEEKWVKEGNKLEDFGKPKKEEPKKDDAWVDPTKK